MTVEERTRLLATAQYLYPKDTEFYSARYKTKYTYISSGLFSIQEDMKGNIEIVSNGSRVYYNGTWAEKTLSTYEQAMRIIKDI